MSYKHPEEKKIHCGDCLPNLPPLFSLFKAAPGFCDILQAFPQLPVLGKNVGDIFAQLLIVSRQRWIQCFSRTVLHRGEYGADIATQQVQRIEIIDTLRKCQKEAGELGDFSQWEAVTRPQVCIKHRECLDVSRNGGSGVNVQNLIS